MYACACKRACSRAICEINENNGLRLRRVARSIVRCPPDIYNRYQHHGSPSGSHCCSLSARAASFAVWPTVTDCPARAASIRWRPAVTVDGCDLFFSYGRHAYFHDCGIFSYGRYAYFHGCDVFVNCCRYVCGEFSLLGLQYEDCRIRWCKVCTLVF